MLESSMTMKIMSNPALTAQISKGRQVGCQPSTVVQLLNCVYGEDLVDASEVKDINVAVKDEAIKYGSVEDVVIPVPPKDGSFTPGVGKIFVEFKDVTSARKFQAELNGRRWDQRTCCAAFYPLDRLKSKKYTLMDN